MTVVSTLIIFTYLKKVDILLKYCPYNMYALTIKIHVNYK